MFGSMAENTDRESALLEDRLENTSTLIEMTKTFEQKWGVFDQSTILARSKERASLFEKIV
jgi:hypothetical protein